jgi:hypothetical protein
MGKVFNQWNNNNMTMMMRRRRRRRRRQTSVKETCPQPTDESYKTGLNNVLQSVADVT